MPQINFKSKQFLKTVKQKIKLHWLDLGVLGLIITVAGVLLWQRAQIKSEWLTVQVKIVPEEWWWRADGPEDWYSQDLQSGKWGFNSFGDKVAQLQNIQTLDIGSGKNQITVWVKLKVGHNLKRDQYIFGFQPIQVGKGLELDFGKQKIKGLVVGMEHDDLKYIEKSIKLRIAALDPITAKAFFVGQQSKTLTGETLATIKRLKITPSVESHYSDIRKQIVNVQNPQFVTLEADIKLKLRQVGEQYLYIDGEPVKIGDSLWIQFPNVVFPDARVIEWLD